MVTNFNNKFGRHGKFGATGEEVARRWLKECGYAVMPISLIDNGGAPLLESNVEKLILPDIMASKSGSSFLIDVKTKRRATRNQVRGRMETGIELRHYRSYLAVGRVTGMRVGLLFIHADRTDMQLGFLDEIGDDAYSWNGPFKPGHAYREPMIFFNIDPNHGSRFTVCRVKEDLWFARLKAESTQPKTRKPWENRLDQPDNGQGFLPEF